MQGTWVTSLGGPLILIPESACPLWGGTPPNYPDDEGDYGRACQVEDYIGLIDVGHTTALVLGDHPARTTFLPDHNVLLREIAGGDDDEVLAAALEHLPTIQWESQLTWEISEPVILFDSARAYTHVVSANEEQLRIDLAPGNYVAEAAYLKVPDTAYLILVRLTPRSCGGSPHAAPTVPPRTATTGSGRGLGIPAVHRVTRVNDSGH